MTSHSTEYATGLGILSMLLPSDILTQLRLVQYICIAIISVSIRFIIRHT